MNKTERRLREQLNEAIAAVRKEYNDRHDFDRGAQSGASMVGHRFCEIVRRDEQLKAEGIKRGSP